MKAQSVFLFTILFVLAFVNGHKSEKCKIDCLRSWTFLQIEKIWSNITDIDWLMSTGKVSRTDIELLKSFETICDRLDQYIPDRVPEEAVNSTWSYAIVDVEAQGISGMYNNLRRYQADVKNELSSRYSYSRAWQDFAEIILQNSDTVPSIPSSIDLIHKHIVGNVDTQQRPLFELILDETGEKLCHVEQSPHQILFNLYNSLQLTQLKGYTMMQFSWMLLRLYKKGDFTLESKLMRDKYMDRMMQQVRSIKQTLKLADQSYWKCDPIHHVEGETYLQLTKLLQGYIQNEIDLNPKTSCSENCGYYSYTKQYGCYKNEFCGNQRNCNGDIVDCRFIDSDMWVCQADPRTSHRRYEYIEYENGRVLGNKGTCFRKNKVDSWWRWVFWHCSYCFCLCDDPKYSDRYFSLKSVLSNTKENKVVVGIRFVKNNGIMHLQIQEAQMLPLGSVNQSSVRWGPIDQFRTNSEGVEEGRDYAMLSYKKRGIDLDDLKAPEGYVVTGVKFRTVGSHINMEVLATPFNFTSGLLEEPDKKSIWISNDNTDAALESPRTEVKLESPDNPLHSLLPSKINSKHDQYLLFTHSDIDLDAAQTTVPFFDAQIVAPQPPTLLNGLGLYHKARRWFGGFIGVKVFTLDYSVYLHDTYPKVNETEFIVHGSVDMLTDVASES